MEDRALTLTIADSDKTVSGPTTSIIASSYTPSVIGAISKPT